MYWDTLTLYWKDFSIYWNRIANTLNIVFATYRLRAFSAMSYAPRIIMMKITQRRNGKVLDLTMGLRVKPDEEMQGLDLSQHGEEGYIFL